MAEIILLKTPSGALVPADSDASAVIERIRTGEGVRAQIKMARRLAFHRKGFALFKLAFDNWEPAGDAIQYKGQSIAKDFDRFRKDITILSGFYRPVYNARGELRLEAESLSWVTMDETRFEQVYRAVLGVVWERVLRRAGYGTTDEVERVLGELMRFE